MYKLLIVLVMLISCNQHTNTRRAEILQLINSDHVNDIVKGYYGIGETKDTFFVKDIFIEPADPRISHHLNFKGMSVYQVKMGAMKKITGVDPPVKITYTPDTTVIKFHLKIARIKQLIR